MRRTGWRIKTRWERVWNRKRRGKDDELGREIDIEEEYREQK